MTSYPPEIFVLGGPNGAGKTTTAGVILPEGLDVEAFVNADLIARSLAPFAPHRSAFTAGRLMLQRMRELREQRQTFAFESTLASRTFAPFLHDARSAGYEIVLVYLWLSSPDLAVERVSGRVRAGGHDVPEADIRRRYERGIRNLFDLYLPLADRWLICDNSERGGLIDIADGEQGSPPRVYEPTRYAIIQQQRLS